MRTVRDPVGRLPRPPEAPEDVVAVDVDDHPSQEEKKTCSSRQVSWPRPQTAPKPPPAADVPAPSRLAESEPAHAGLFCLHGNGIKASGSRWRRHPPAAVRAPGGRVASAGVQCRRWCPCRNPLREQKMAA